MAKLQNKYTPTTRRSSEQIREHIANILLMEISDPRLRFVTITGCDVSPDKKNAKIYYTTEKSKYKDVEDSFNSANKYIRKLLGDRLSWRVVPKLNFYLDYSIDLGEQITLALDKEKKSR